MVLFFFCLQLGIFLSSLCCWGKSNYLHPCIQCLEETSRCHIFSGSVLIIEKPYSHHWNKLHLFSSIKWENQSNTYNQVKYFILDVKFINEKGKNNEGTQSFSFSLNINSYIHYFISTYFKKDCSLIETSVFYYLLVLFLNIGYNLHAIKGTQFNYTI